jgi:cytochrome c oxidase assembly factor CtaG
MHALIRALGEPNAGASGHVRSGRGVRYARAPSFVFGAAVRVAALVSPLDPLGEILLSVHMAQHGLVVTHLVEAVPPTRRTSPVATGRSSLRAWRLQTRRSRAA